jgi:hypothetical protein
MMDDQNAPKPTVAAALRHWRGAEQTVALARRGKIAAEAAANAAAEAAEAAKATAEAATAALAASTLAEKSAAKTAAAAKIVAMATVADLADADADTALAEVGEVDAHQRYREATSRAAQRPATRPR